MPNTRDTLTIVVNKVKLVTAIIITATLIAFGLGLLTGFEVFHNGSGGGGPVVTPTTSPPVTPTTSPTGTPTGPPSTVPPTTAPPTEPPPNPGNDVAGCPTTNQLTGTPSGNSFAGHVYNGHGASLPAGKYTIGSNTCVENYIFNNSNLTFSGSPSNVIVVNNTFQNWPAMRAIENVQGTNISVNYNTIKATAGGAWTGIFGQGAFNNVVVDHNNIGPMNAAVDGIQLRFTGGGTNVSVSYNNIQNNGRFPIELQQVVHGLKVLHNNVSFNKQGGNQLGQISVAVGNDMDSGGYYPTESSGVEVAYNIVKNLDSTDIAACFEARGPGDNFHDNVCDNYSALADYAMTHNANPPQPWFITNNTVRGRGSGAMAWYEGYNRDGFTPVTPTETGNTRIPLSGTLSPALLLWDYPNGIQPNVP